MRNGPELEIKFAFERDVIRKKGYKGFRSRPTSLKICETCGDGFESKAFNVKYCPDCRPAVQRDRLRKQWFKTYKPNRRQVRVERNAAIPVETEQAWMDFAFAIVEGAFREHDGDFLEDLGMEFLAFSGRPLNKRKFDGLLEDMNGQKETKEPA